jgi:hypothetical protein
MLIHRSIIPMFIHEYNPSINIIAQTPDNFIYQYEISLVIHITITQWTKLGEIRLTRFPVFGGGSRPYA